MAVHRNVMDVNPAGFRATLGIRSIRFLGVRIDQLHLGELLSAVRSAVVMRVPIDVMYVNVHTMNLASRYPQYRALLNRADIVYCDGTGVRLGAHLLDLDIPERMTGADWIHDLCRLAVREDLSLFLLGAPSGIAGQAAMSLLV